MSTAGENAGATGKKKKQPEATLATDMSWVGTKVTVNTLTGSGAFDPRVPIDQPGEEGDDALIWADVPKKLKQRLLAKPQLITEECLLENAKGILRLYNNDIVQHVISHTTAAG